MFATFRYMLASFIYPKMQEMLDWKDQTIDTQRQEIEVLNTLYLECKNVCNEYKKMSEMDRQKIEYLKMEINKSEVMSDISEENDKNYINQIKELQTNIKTLEATIVEQKRALDMYKNAPEPEQKTVTIPRKLTKVETRLLEKLANGKHYPVYGERTPKAFKALYEMGLVERMGRIAVIHACYVTPGSKEGSLERLAPMPIIEVEKANEN